MDKTTIWLYQVGFGILVSFFLRSRLRTGTTGG
jgi:hypothetical protein